ncbi:hypothetical protein [Entomospira culicis]|uniref:Uncharacterized protein n=1 Tax=Entomospira culicis TaxID=2719989 RepID=A0A968GEW1_9SPIO|nr:hypothetical protein [Entomospira culicis]NIZ19112.1 hypothetical protein [Entomospira culicis]NIZ69326.1 hypothetical protein [Entomospira culicis]WDI37912.1 hypothetical protein PVA46_03745 [Entomospira culicis]WDI39539.1 hypothetical protein PVA47_03745 [Entomospira culicis]
MDHISVKELTEKLTKFSEMDEVLARLNVFLSTASSLGIMPEYWGLAEVAAFYNISTGTLNQCPWLLPNFGIPDINPKRRRWLQANVIAWAKAAPQHRQTWVMMSKEERGSYINWEERTPLDLPKQKNQKRTKVTA